MNTYNKLQEAIIENGGVECEQVPDAFFTELEGGDQNLAYKTKTAKAVCGRCPVAAVCLEYALESNERYGIWGGLTPDERRRLKAGRRTSEIVYRGNSRRAEGQRIRFTG